MNHLSRIEIFAAMFDAVPYAAHLEKCDRCVERIVALHELAPILGGAVTGSGVDSAECRSTEEIVEYLEGAGVSRKGFRAHLQSCDRCFEKAAHYFAESSHMACALEPLTPRRYRQAAFNLVQGESLFRRWFIAPLPAYAAGVAVALVLLLTPAGPRVQVMKEAPFFGIYEKKFDTLPYFYFNGEGKKAGSSLSGMKVTTGRGEVRFEWNPVGNASSYYFMLQEMANEVPVRTKTVKTYSPEVVLPAEELRLGVSYRWIAAGNTGADLYFQGKMEFRLTPD